MLPVSRFLDAASACKEVKWPRISASTALIAERVRPIASLCIVWRSCRTSSTPAATASTSTGATAPATSRESGGWSLMTFVHNNAHGSLENDPYLDARGNDEARRPLQEAERLGRRLARQPAARMPPQAVRGDRLPAPHERQRGDHLSGRGQRV